MSDGLASAAKLLAEPARAAMLLELMSGRSLPAGELAAAANVSAQTASEHLARLAEGGFVTDIVRGGTAISALPRLRLRMSWSRCWCSPPAQRSVRRLLEFPS